MSRQKKGIPLKRESIVLSFDFGTKNIGLAVGQLITKTASPIKAISAKNGIPDWQQLDEILREWKPDLLVVGVPVHMDGKESNMSKLAQKFSRRVAERFHLPCVTMDERLSSFEAGQIAKGKENIDSLSACLILESWFNQGDFEL